ncbi:MAG: amino acid permease [Gammaproteobacteria bacterium]
MMMFKFKYLQYLKGICLVAGTCIGAGMIGVPVKTGVVGLIPTMLAFICIWGIMTASALLLLEASLAFKIPVNFISITKNIFGDLGKNIAWGICILFMYSVMAAYASGGAGIFNQCFPKVKLWLSTIIFMLPFGLIVYFGNQIVSLFNRFLMLGVIICFLLLCSSIILVGGEHLQPITNVLFNKHNCEIKFLFLALPLMVVTFSYHEIIPPLAAYLKFQIKPLKAAILLGSIIPLVVYIVWELVILWLIPESGKGGLKEMLLLNKNPNNSLIEYIALHYNNKFILNSLAGFSFFALTGCLTSSAWALFDFLADGLSIPKDTKGKLLLSFITFVPPVIYTIFFSNGFMKALSLAGGFSAIIMIIYPGLIVWRLRYIRKNIVHHECIKNLKEITYQAPFGKLTILGISLFGILIIVLEIINHIY